MKVAKAAPAILGILLLALAACGGAAHHPASTLTNAAASCSSLHDMLTKVEHDAAQQEQLVATVYRAKPSFPTSAIAKAWLPLGTYSKDLKALAAAVRPYGNAPGNEVSQVTNDAGVLNADLSTSFGGASPGVVEPLPDNWQMDFSDFQADIWTLASDCGMQQGTKWGVPLLHRLKFPVTQTLFTVAKPISVK